MKKYRKKFNGLMMFNGFACSSSCKMNVKSLKYMKLQIFSLLAPFYILLLLLSPLIDVLHVLRHLVIIEYKRNAKG